MRSLDESLGFAPDGKLEKLCLAGFPNLLHEWEQEIDLGGKSFRPAGWDECFPTIDPYQGSPIMGELIGLAPEISWPRAGTGTTSQADCVEQIWSGARFEARRRFSLQTPCCLEMSFQVTNRQGAPLEFLWASHALFSVAILQKIRLANGAELARFDMDSSEEKVFLSNLGPVEFSYPKFRVLLTSDQPWWGIWLNRGGWPEKSPNPLRCLGVEATNTPGEQPDGQWLQAGATFSRKVKLEIHSELFS